MPRQPSGMRSNNGVILSIGMFANGEPFEIVNPMATNSTAFDPSNLCQDAVQSFVNDVISDLVPILSSDCYVSFVQAEGMVNGCIPFRDTFAPTAHPGTAAPAVAPTQVAALIVYYEDPEDTTGPARTRVAKSFMSGISRADLVGNQVDSDLLTKLQLFADDMQGGYPSFNDGGSNWYRVLNVPKPRTGIADIKRTIVDEVRGSVYTQKRRLTPRP